jgi:hypothetical protein
MTCAMSIDFGGGIVLIWLTPVVLTAALTTLGAIQNLELDFGYFGGLLPVYGAFEPQIIFIYTAPCAKIGMYQLPPF